MHIHGSSGYTALELAGTSFDATTILLPPTLGKKTTLTSTTTHLWRRRVRPKNLQYPWCVGLRLSHCGSAVAMPQPTYAGLTSRALELQLLNFYKE